MTQTIFPALLPSSEALSLSVSFALAFSSSLLQDEVSHLTLCVFLGVLC